MWHRKASVSYAIIGSENGLAPTRRQAIIWFNAGILLIGSSGTNLSENSIEIHQFSFKKMHLKMPSVKWRPFCVSLNVLRNVFSRSMAISRKATWHYLNQWVWFELYFYKMKIFQQRSFGTPSLYCFPPSTMPHSNPMVIYHQWSIRHQRTVFNWQLLKFQIYSYKKELFEVIAFDVAISWHLVEIG